MSNKYQFEAGFILNSGSLESQSCELINNSRRSMKSIRFHLDTLKGIVETRKPVERAKTIAYIYINKRFFGMDHGESFEHFQERVINYIKDFEDRVNELREFFNTI